MVTTKGVGILFEAARILLTQHRPFELLVIGDGPERAALERLAQDAPLARHVRFAGRLSDAELNAALAHATVVVVPSLGGEVFGLVVVENMLRGLPVIASDLGAFVEVLGEGRTHVSHWRGGRACASTLHEFWTIPLSRPGSRGWHGNVLSIFAIFAACWKATRALTVRLERNLSGKAGTPCVTKKETLSRLGATGPYTEARENCVCKASLFSDGTGNGSYLWQETEKMKRALVFFAAFVVVLVAASGVWAEPQQSKGTSTLSGVVIGPNDRPAPHASVSYQSSDGSAPHAVYADAHGRFTISKLKADSYDIRASAKGIFSDWQRNIPLRKGQARSVELHLIYAKEMPQSVSSTKPKQ